MKSAMQTRNRWPMLNRITVLAILCLYPLLTDPSLLIFAKACSKERHWRLKMLVVQNGTKIMHLLWRTSQVLGQTTINIPSPWGPPPFQTCFMPPLCAIWSSVNATITKRPWRCSWLLVNGINTFAAAGDGWKDSSFSFATCLPGISKPSDEWNINHNDPLLAT